MTTSLTSNGSDSDSSISENNNYIIRLLDVIEDRKSIHIITELCEGGELYDYIDDSEHDQNNNEELRCATIIFQILTAFQFLHDDANIAHRDLKASNFVFVRKPSISISSLELRIIDFGLSKYKGLYSKNYKYMTSEVGTPYYVAPEVLTQQRYTTKCDIWSIGVLAYLTLTGTLPVMGKDELETVHKLMNPNLEVDFSNTKFKKKISRSAQDFCRALLQHDPKKRPTAQQALRFDWIVKHCGESNLESKSESQSFTDVMGVHHNHRSRRRLPSLSTYT
ncbi:Pkinase-domain-containing protein [Fragilariopsis cylindrus CCMP1102]|uniref:Pkinase-domain-containing protein n=1 Tax=Fragilariopsis cylindrus CCMP1102 TaxID=635003 RepID=A0A1E7FCH2_9STRA|nr:Pkinase-domain-containing protein [Fragilariopsis cylindrus CCMP1102]|eukprot:OEU15878.1 Pkinase-domain-containing protein [Fragilariopsis cylindrus CCMP1102]